MHDRWKIMSTTNREHDPGIRTPQLKLSEINGNVGWEIMSIKLSVWHAETYYILHKLYLHTHGSLHIFHLDFHIWMNDWICNQTASMQLQMFALNWISNWRMLFGYFWDLWFYGCQIDLLRIDSRVSQKSGIKWISNWVFFTARHDSKFTGALSIVFYNKWMSKNQIIHICNLNSLEEAIDAMN